ncbi:DUF1799 domain-containing protein [Leptospira sp. 96542]|nr:DUF1799 domain-containing protein [Leptospira sp. 96542]
MRPEGAVEDDAEQCYPDNWMPMLVFKNMATQWVVDRGYRIGLRYEALPVVMGALGVPKKSRADVLWALGHMEFAALEVLNKQR